MRRQQILIVLLIAVAFIFCIYKNMSTQIQNISIQDRVREDIKSVYIGQVKDVEAAIKLVKSLGANAVVIDVKDDFGMITFDMDVPMIRKAPSCMSNISEKMKEFKKGGIYTIARIVAFKDFVRGDLCIKSNDGSIYVDKEKSQWLDPYDPKVWEYLIKISEESVKVGFDEIQFDYIRFSSYLKNDPDNKRADGMSRCDIILRFLKLACDIIKKGGANVSVDVFGCIVGGATDISALKNSSILGQDYVELAKVVDYICPMIYPSHFPPKSMGINHPDLDPYGTVYRFVLLSNKMLDSVPHRRAIIRPYLQAFTAKWLPVHQKYGRKQVDEQIKAVLDAGLSQWGLFDFSCKYAFSH
jgi:hypothetical protein